MTDDDLFDRTTAACGRAFGAVLSLALSQDPPIRTRDDLSVLMQRLADFTENERFSLDTGDVVSGIIEGIAGVLTFQHRQAAESPDGPPAEIA